MVARAQSCPAEVYSNLWIQASINADRISKCYQNGWFTLGPSEYSCSLISWLWRVHSRYIWSGRLNLCRLRNWTLSLDGLHQLVYLCSRRLYQRGSSSAREFLISGVTDVFASSAMNRASRRKRVAPDEKVLFWKFWGYFETFCLLDIVSTG